MTSQQAAKFQSPGFLKGINFIAQIIFLLTGILLTLAAFLGLTMFIERLVKAEYERTMENALQDVAGKLSDLERSLDLVASMVSLAPDQDKLFIMEKIKSMDKRTLSFSQIAYFYEGPSESLRYYNLYVSQPGPFKFAASPAALRASLQKISSLPDRASILDLKYPGVNAATPFFIMAKQAIDNTNTPGFIVAVVRADLILDKAWQKRHHDISALVLQDRERGRSLVGFQRKGATRHPSRYISQIYEFDFAGKRMEARIQYKKNEGISFIETIPFMVIGLGFILTAGGLIHIRGMQRYSLRVSRINSALEEKNRELKNEIAQRARLISLLKKSEEKNRSVIDSVSDIIFETDMDGRLLFVNATWQKITGFTAEQSQGLNLFRMLHPADQNRQQEDFNLMAAGRKQPYRSFTRLRVSNGTFRAAELSLSMTRRDENGKLRVVGTIVDIEERYRAERALTEAEKKYRTIVENAAGGIFQLTPEGVYLSANPAFMRILGYKDYDDLLCHVKNAHESVYLNIRERQYFLKELEISGAISGYETQVLKKDGARIWVNENIRAVKDDEGTTLFYEGSLEDVTQRKETEMALREAKIHSDLANRAKSEFLSNMSHELRTPLNAIIGFSEIIKNQTFGPVGQAAYKDYAGDIYESGRNLLTIINEILDIAKIDAGERLLKEQSVDIYALVESITRLLGSKAASSNLTVCNMLENVPQIVGEELAIKQILVNLLSNAIKFTPAGGRISITNNTDSSGAFLLSITDTGIGLDESEIEKALSPFGQVDNAFNKNHAGTGLGLTLAAALVRLHEGRLELFSEKGIGTTVTVIFPAVRVSKSKQRISYKKESL